MPKRGRHMTASSARRGVRFPCPSDISLPPSIPDALLGKRPFGRYTVEVRFAAMCVDLVAQAEGCSSQEMYQRLKKVGLIHGLTTHLDALHTQSKEYVTNDLLQALHRLEAAQTNKQ